MARRINVPLPDELHRRVKAEAALADKTLRDFVVAALQAAVSSPKDHDGQRDEGRRPNA